MRLESLVGAGHAVPLPTIIALRITTVRESTQRLQSTGSLLKFIKNFQGRLEQGHNQWASTVDKRSAIQSHMNHHLFLPLKSLISEVKRLANENDDRLCTLNSLLAIEVSSSSESFFVQIKSFVDIRFAALVIVLQ